MGEGVLRSNRRIELGDWGREVAAVVGVKDLAGSLGRGHRCNKSSGRVSEGSAEAKTASGNAEGGLSPGSVGHGKPPDCFEARAHQLIKAAKGGILQGRRGDTRAMSDFAEGAAMAKQKESGLSVRQGGQGIEEGTSPINTSLGMLVAEGGPAHSTAKEGKLSTASDEASRKTAQVGAARGVRDDDLRFARFQDKANRPSGVTKHPERA